MIKTAMTKVKKQGISGAKRQKNHIFHQKSAFFLKKVWKLKKSAYLCNPKRKERGYKMRK